MSIMLKNILIGLSDVLSVIFGLINAFFPIIVILVIVIISKNSSKTTSYIEDADKSLDKFIDETFTKFKIDAKTNIKDFENRRFIFYILLSVIVFLFNILVLFHVNMSFMVLLLIATIIMVIVFLKYDVKRYLKKEIKARPDENMENIIVSAMQDKVPKKNYLPLILLAVVLPLLFGVNPHIFYEKVDGGYRVRFYTIGLSSLDKITIPEYYKNEKIVGIRGDVFANLYTLKKISLPDSIKEIRGNAFANDYSLETIKLPSNLEYLGGGAFRNSGLISIELPESLKEVRGETFKNCYNLKYVKLPSNISEIRGNTFENDSELVSIDIPDSVERIGGHAFYGCTKLTNVNISDNSSLKEIGSSAFRRCDSLDNIRIPYSCYVNERAFKESPTSIQYTGVPENHGGIYNYGY